MTRFEGDTELLGFADAAAIAGISTRTLAFWARRGLIESVVTADGQRFVTRGELAKHVVMPNQAEPPDD